MKSDQNHIHWTDTCPMRKFLTIESYIKIPFIPLDCATNNLFYLILFYRYFLRGDLQYFLVTPHWMCTNVWRPLRFSSSLLLSEGTPRVPRPGIEPRTYRIKPRTYPESNPGPTNNQINDQIPFFKIQKCSWTHLYLLYVHDSLRY